MSILALFHYEHDLSTIIAWGCQHTMLKTLPLLRVVALLLLLRRFHHRLQRRCELRAAAGVSQQRLLRAGFNTWVVVKIMVPFWALIIIRPLVFRIPKKGL